MTDLYVNYTYREDWGSEPGNINYECPICGHIWKNYPWIDDAMCSGMMNDIWKHEPCKLKWRYRDD